jgi:predicted nucleic acid-binding protein
MSGVVFVDTNILIYAHDQDAGVKRERAIQHLRELWDSRLGALSVQVLQEFYVNVTRKLASPVAVPIAREVVETYGTWIRAATTVDTITRASHIAELAQISFWDAMIVASAEEAGASQIYTEDLNAGQSLAGILVVNPLTTA